MAAEEVGAEVEEDEEEEVAVDDEVVEEEVGVVVSGAGITQAMSLNQV